MRLSYEEKRKRVQEFRPIDDTFFEVFANDVDVCQEILRVILQDPNLEVETVSVQTNYKNLSLIHILTLRDGRITAILFLFGGKLCLVMLVSKICFCCRLSMGKEMVHLFQIGS